MNFVLKSRFKSNQCTQNYDRNFSICLLKNSIDSFINILHTFKQNKKGMQYIMKQIIMNKQQDKKQILLLEDGELKEKYIESANIRRIEGNIYIGKVKDVLQGMQAAFIDIGLEKTTFIHLKDILPKVDISKEKEDFNDKDVKKIVKSGMPILVQVKKDFTDSKGAKVSTHLSINSRYIIFMPNTEIVTISKKIEDKKERDRLVEIIKKYLPQNCGAIVRTSAENQSEDRIKNDVEIAVKKWNEIKLASDKCMSENKYPKLIYKTHGIVKKLLLDLMDKDLQGIEVNSKEDYEYINKMLKEFNEEKISLKLKEMDLLENNTELNKQIKKSDRRKVWLKCGGFIAIDKTEALTAIDVNSGKYIGKDNAEATIFKVNKQASIEIAKQLRLRDIGGIVIIDYIDMQDDENKKKIIDILSEELKKDRSKTQVVGFSKLNLLEMTRKHICSSDEN